MAPHPNRKALRSNRRSPPEIHTKKTVNGKTLVDDYAWLRERSNPDVKALLEAENAYAAYLMRPTEARQKKLYEEIVSHIKESDDTVPFLKDGYYYYTRTEKGKQYFQLCRKKGSLQAPEQIILDLNQMGEGQKFMAVGHGRLATTEICWPTPPTMWDSASITCTYATCAPCKTCPILPSVWCRSHGRPIITRCFIPSRTKCKSAAIVSTDIRWEAMPSRTRLVYEEKDERFDIYISRTRSKQYLLLNSSSHISSEVSFLPADKPEGQWTLIAPRRDNIEYMLIIAATRSTSAPTTRRRLSG